jgi:3-phenylpropionate/trans-cinnamate dioxygenase ferredoxin reductase component
MLGAATGSAATAVIVGANVTGGRAAETLRAEGFDGHIVLIGAEPVRPYERPPLSKGYLAGSIADDDIFLRPLDFYDEQSIELRLGVRATRLDPGANAVTLDTGETIHYDTLLIATGATPRRLDIPGAMLDGVHYLRTLEDAKRLRQRMTSSSRIVVIGMGFIGAEIAAASREAGLDVVALEAGDQPMQGALGQEVGQRLAQIHRSHGVDLRTNVVVRAIRGDDRALEVVTDADTLACDMVAIGVGVTPEVGWLAGSGLEIDRGIVTDAACRASLPGIFAAGDVATQYHPRYGRHLIVEHFDHAGSQGAAAAKSMLGLPAPDVPLPFFWSDQFDLTIQVAGMTTGHDQVVFRGDVDSGSWSAFYLEEGTFIAALAVNRFRDLSASRRILNQGIAVDAALLADESVELRSLLSGAGR